MLISTQINILKKLLLTLLLTVYTLNTVLAQKEYETGFITTFSAAKSLKNNTSLGFATETRPVLSEGEYNGEKESGFRMELHQFGINLIKKIKKHTFGNTFILRFRDNTTHYRNSFQYTYTTKLKKVNFSNRLVADQTYTSEDFPIFRFRYRIGMVVPFKGDKISPKMFYAKITHEYLSIFEEAIYELELRLTPAIGYQISDNAKIEIGLESRIGRFIQKKGAFENDFWINTGLSIKL